MSNPDLHDARGSVFLGNSREDRQRRVGTVGGFIGNCIETPEKRPLFETVAPLPEKLTLFEVPVR
jgi:hypothetical protein